MDEKLLSFRRVEKQTLVTGVTVVLAILALIFVMWFWLTVVPVLVIEAKYQFYKTLQTTFHTTSLKQLFTLDLSFLDLRGNTKHRQFGIVIPEIYVDEPVIFNVDPNNSHEYTQALKKGIAHASGTAFPDTGGLGYYFAHSTSAEFTNQLKAVFYLLGKLEVNDEVFIWFEGKRFEYKVTKTQVTSPADTQFLSTDYPRETIVLQTCWPPGSTKERLLVFAERSPSSP